MVAKMKDNWLSFLGQGVRHLRVSHFEFACGLRMHDNTWWESDNEAPACQKCVQEQMRL